MNSIRFFIKIIMLFLVTEIGAYRILCVFPLNFKSHNLLFQSLMKGLAKRGHQVDVISYYELSNPPQNYKTILNLANLNSEIGKMVSVSVQEMIDSTERDIVKTTEYTYGLDICELLNHKEMQNIIRNPPKDPGYDLVLTEGLALSCFYGLGFIFQVPVVTVTASLEFPWTSENIGNPLSTAFFPTFQLSKSEIKTFWDRLRNTIRARIDIHRFLSFTENQSPAMRKYFGPNSPTVREVEKLVALSIVNTHYTIQGIRPTTPAFLEVAGLHIEADESKLTGKLKKWMDNSKDGVVYFSLGTVIPIAFLPNEMLQVIYKSFAKIAPVKVLMKETKEMKFPPGIPKNVITMSWIPQMSILEHNNTRAFITHGGIHSVQEAIYFGIPSIGIPIFYDQYQNVEILVKKKMGIQLSPAKMTENFLDEALGKILNDPKYREAAKYNSKLFRDRPMSPMSTAVYWMEYVIRNGGTALKSPAVDLYWWQVELLDVYGFLLLSFLITIYLILIILKVTFKVYFSYNVKEHLKKD